MGILDYNSLVSAANSPATALNNSQPGSGYSAPLGQIGGQQPSAQAGTWQMPTMPAMPSVAAPQPDYQAMFQQWLAQQGLLNQQPNNPGFNYGGGSEGNGTGNVDHSDSPSAGGVNTAGGSLI